MKLDGGRFSLPIQPVVLRDLAMPLNLSGPFLKKHRIDPIHSQNIISVDGQTF